MLAVHPSATTPWPPPAQNTAKVAGVEQTFIDNNGDGIVDFLFKSTPNLAKVTVYNTTDMKLTIAGIGSVDFADVADYDDVAKDDMVLVTKLNETYYLTKSKSVSGKVTAYSNSTNKVTLDGTDYGQSAATVTTSATDLTAFTADQSYISNSYTFYLDAYGNAVAWTVSEETVGNYALVLATGGTSASGDSSVIDKGEVKLLLTDGTTATYNVNLLASDNKFAIGGSDSQKEAAMSARLALASGNANSFVNTLVTYAVGEDKNVIIGNPVTTTSYAFVTAGNGTTAPSNATFPAQRSTTRYSFTGTNAQTVTVNDSTTANATVKSAVYTVTSANPNVAKAVWVDGTFKGTSNYVYIGTGNLTVAVGGSLEVTTTNSHTTGTLKLPTVPTALTVKDGVTTVTGAAAAAVTVEGGVANIGGAVTGALLVKAGAANIIGTASAAVTVEGGIATVGSITNGVVTVGKSGVADAGGTLNVGVSPAFAGAIGNGGVTLHGTSALMAGAVSGALTMANTANVTVTSAASYANTGTGTLAITAAISGLTTLPVGKVVIKETPTAALTMAANSNVTFEKTLDVQTILTATVVQGVGTAMTTLWLKISSLS